jgi:hypothetical protein
MTDQPTLPPRTALRMILARYDHDAGMAPGVWKIVKQLQQQIAWRRHVDQMRWFDKVSQLNQKG